MAAKGTYLDNALLDHVLGGGDYSRPATVYVALYTSSPGPGGGGTECSGFSYARASVTNDGTNWDAASSGSKQNNADISFPTASGEGWGDVTHFGIWDNSTGGNLLYYGPLGSTKTINDGDTPKLLAYSLTITEA
ncbi:MAG TPA: hypothetical protein VGP72_10515 [Planctomycetota bacterium]|jgi:hypothetical protein